VSNVEIYKWVKNGIINQIKSKTTGVDYDAIDFIVSLYEMEIVKFKKGGLQLLNPESDRYRELLVDKIIALQNDLDITLSSYITYFVHNKGKELIITLDNCDKRNLTEQLLMFEVANWIKDSIKAIVFLPLRDTTFDHFRREKPLDTVVKDLTFRITPPSLEKVLYNRIKYASRLAEKGKDRYYFLSNNIKVSYPAKDELYYLKGILSSLFQNKFFKKLISGLAGSDTRVGLEIFLDFCKSGHISENDIFKMKQAKGDYKLPNHVVSKVFLRGNREYYNDATATIKNIFVIDPSDDLPDPFVRVSILKWLYERYRIKGPSGILGFHSVESLLNHLISLGHERKRLETEILSLIRYSLVISESQKTDFLDLKELISINYPGIIHLDLISNIDYLGACAEDVWYNVVETANRIAVNMSGEGSYTHLSLQSTLENSQLLIDYLNAYYKKYFWPYSQYLSEDIFFKPIDFDDINFSLTNYKKAIGTSSHRQLEAGTKIIGKIVNIKNYGIIVELNDSNQAGLIPAASLKDIDFETTYKFYDLIEVEILKYSAKHKKYELKLNKSNA